MLKLEIQELEKYDEARNEFLNVKAQTIQLEHSLVSLSKWEAKWHKPFLSKEEKTLSQTLDYIKCMTITQNVDPDVYKVLTPEHIKMVREYIEEKMTATTFANESNGINREIITAELIYYWMITFNIPFECRKWHLNQLLTLINVCNIKNTPPKKKKAGEIAKERTALNEERKRQLNTKG